MFKAVSENLYNSAHKATNQKFRDGYDCMHWGRGRDKAKRKEREERWFDRHIYMHAIRQAVIAAQKNTDP